MISLPDDLPDDPVLLKQMLLEALNRQEEVAQAYQAHIVDLKGQIKLLRDRLFGRKSEQTAEPNTPQLALFNEPESEPMPLIGDAEEEVVSPLPRRGKRKALSAELPRVEVIHELPEHELTCACGCRKHVISEQLDIVPMQIRVIKHIRKVYGCRGCETAPVTADKPAQLIEKSMASPSVLAMLLTVRRWLAAASFRDGVKSTRYRYTKANTGALGDAVQRTLSATAELNARPITGKPGDPLR